ncbi:MAG: hypothetical protein LBR08_10565 [Bacteroidales bacterium]|jgi:hypothetical protein|nr:hypothetical protein [Bacteroidales bacterium]
MAHTIDYLPQKESKLVIWGDNFAKQVTLNATAWEIPASDVAELQTALDNFKTLYEQADSPQKNSIIVAEKNTAKKAFKDKVRELANFRLKNPVITDAQRVATGLRVRDAKPTRISVPNTRPRLNLGVVDIRELSVRIRDTGSSRRARPYGVIGAVLAMAVLDAPPTSIDRLTRTALVTRTPYTLKFTEEERGKTVYAAACWQNERGERGHFSEIVSAVIP